MSETINPGDRFDVHLQRSGRTLTVPPGESILDILLDNGIDVAFSCSDGICGTCETKVIEGIPDHRDSFLSDEDRAENSKIMICCSRSKTSSACRNATGSDVGWRSAIWCCGFNPRPCDASCHRARNR